MRVPFGDHTGCRSVPTTLLSNTGATARGDTAALYKRPPSLDHVTHANDLPSGDHAGSDSMLFSVDTRRGVPPG